MRRRGEGVRDTRHSLLGDGWLDGGSGSLGLADGSVFAEGDSPLSLSSLALSSEPALRSSPSAAFSGAAPEACRGENADREKEER